ncbi:Penicillin acylase 2 precursor [Pigmentiphaga humi]|uniref:Penicillin acylase 2 n=1 Tax=Pigmentiphaga humi TaxID=2478468 RepID=A0A3P4B2I7_9BURK|nr:penicillin acylase family protein [Pigmentiphaga humi]VCU69776.1 Penicillin acylase 2 precursor [Pigmentiphaga humi]
MPSRRLFARAVGIALVLAVAVPGLGAAGAWFYLRASLPQIDGRQQATGMRAPADIARDAQGTVTIRAASREDAAYATGYAHAQDRYFQMDLTRRAAAGELSALVGEAALPLDRKVRLHRFRARAAAAYPTLPPEHRALLERYAAGVNAGLAALDARPFEYAVLRAAPEPWLPVDTLLVIDAMYLDLQGGELQRALSLEGLRRLLPAELVEQLAPAGSPWDAPLDRAPAASQPPASAAAPMPRPDWLDARRPARQYGPTPAELMVEASSALGSNAWAVAATQGADGRARVANDMHLGLRLPGTWYRLTLQFPADGGTRRVSGVNLPGVPVVVAGSNGDVAWGFTNSYGHFIELVRLDLDPADPRRYRDADGAWRTAAETVERIEIKGEPAVDLPVRETHWGPMLQVGDQTYALRWIAYLPSAVNVVLADMETARGLGQALDIARRTGMPTQNLVAADRSGRIGWTLAGPLPATPLEPTGFPVEATQARAPMARLAPDAYPSVIDPAYGRLWTANSTQLADSAAQRRIGDGGADVGARATRIRDALFAADRFDERSLLAIQLDDEARWIGFLRDQALAALDDAAVAGDPRRAAFRRLVQSWDGKASAGSAGYALLRGYYDALYDAWFGPLDERLGAIEQGLSARRASSRLLPVMERLVRERAWIPAYAADWRAFMLDRIDTTIEAATAGGTPLEAVRWGNRNRLSMAHPLARALPAFVLPWLSAPAEPMPGDIHMPRIQGRSFGASERFVVAPGDEESGILELPGGASGHPLSPFFLAGHDNWVKGAPSPFLPGPDAHVLTLDPAGG